MGYFYKGQTLPTVCHSSNHLERISMSNKKREPDEHMVLALETVLALLRAPIDASYVNTSILSIYID